MFLKPASLALLLMLSVSTLAAAQTKSKPQIKVRPNTTTCSVSFNNALPRFCVTPNGNIEDFEFPEGFSQIFTEGYGICDLSGQNRVSYFDVGTRDSGNWLTATVTNGGANNKLPLTIARTTSDGIWTLTKRLRETPPTNM